MSLGFQWDLRKAAVNETKHGVAFARGRRVTGAPGHGGAARGTGSGLVPCFPSE